MKPRLVIALILIAGAATAQAAALGVGPNNFIDRDGGADAQTRREQAKQQCQAEMGLGSFSSLSGSLGNILNQGWESQLPQIANGVIQQNLPAELQQQMSREVDQSLRRNFPQAFATNIRNSGLSDTQLSNALPRLIQETLTGITPQVSNDLRQRRSTILLNALQAVFGQNLPAELQAIIPELLAGDFEQRLGEMVNQVAGRPEINQGTRDTISNNLLGLIGQDVGGGLNPQSLGGLSSILGQNYSSPLNGILGGHLNYFSGNILGPLENSVGQIGNAFLAPVNGALLGLQNVALQPLNTLVSSVTQAFTAPLTQLTSSITQAITAPLNQLTQAITAPLNNLTQSLTGQIQSIFNPAVSNAVGGLAGQASGALGSNAAGLAQQSLAGTPLAGTQLGQEVGGGLTGGIQSTTAGVGAPPGGGGGGAVGLAVPVQEIFGPLLFLTQNIDTTTKTIDSTTQQIKSLTEEIKKLQIESCTHLKVIRDMELAQEEQNYVYDREAKKAADTAGTDLWQWFKENILQQGRAISQGLTGVEGAGASGQPTVNKNQEQNLRDAKTEATGLVVEGIKQGDNIFKNEMAAAIETQKNSPLEEPTITKAQYDSLKEPWKLSGEEYNRLVQLASKDGNNLPSAVMQALDLRNQKVAQAEEEQNREFVSSGGYHALRKCVAWAGQFCANWVTLASASFVRFLTEYLGGNTLASILDANKLGQDGAKADLGQRVSSLVNQSEEGATPPPTPTSDPCPGPDPCPNTGWQPNSVDFSGSQGLIQGLIDSASGSGGGSGDGGGGGGDGSGLPPFDFDLPSPVITSFRTELQSSGNRTVVWSTQDALLCQASNDWAGTTPQISQWQIVEPRGQVTIKSGNDGDEIKIQCLGFNLENVEQSLRL